MTWTTVLGFAGAANSRAAPASTTMMQIARMLFLFIKISHGPFLGILSRRKPARHGPAALRAIHSVLASVFVGWNQSDAEELRTAFLRGGNPRRQDRADPRQTGL